ncbi:MAG TPA: Crp/Fnr family transcriptional regulator [Deinococcales bacterium]|nr:Crp/Fnr family transcriptional regulator [Deinococcales bacterium]
MPVIASNHQLLEILPPEERQVLERLCPPRRFKKGDPVYRYQDRADDLYIVLEGKVKISVPTPDGGERILSILGPGDFFGESFLSGQERHSSEAVAVTERVVASPVCADKIMRMPNVALSLARVLAMRVQELESQLEATTAPVGARVGNSFLAFARRFGEGDGPRKSVKLDLTHEELAAFVGSTRVTVTNALGELRDLGLVEGTRGQYEINVPALEEYVESQGLVHA